jgi:hypothetical protein
LKEEALDRIKWRNRFGRGCGPVVWQITDDDEVWEYSVTQHVRKFQGSQFWLIELAIIGPYLYKEQFIVTKLLHVRLRTDALAVYVFKKPTCRSLVTLNGYFETSLNVVKDCIIRCVLFS